MSDRSVLRSLVRGAYDLQKLRIQAGNRLVTNYRVRLGQQPGTLQEDIEDEDAQKILRTMKNAYKRMADALVETGAWKLPDTEGVIADSVEFHLVAQYVAIEKEETRTFQKALPEVLSAFSIFPWLNDQPGIGPAMAGVIISELDIHDGPDERRKYVSSLWKYAGMDVVAGWEIDRIEPISGPIPSDLLALIPARTPLVGDVAVNGESVKYNEEARELTVRYRWDDRAEACDVVYKLVSLGGRSRRKEHLIEKAYLDKNDKEKTKMSITFNPWLKTKLYVLAGSMLKTKGRKNESRYVKVYDDYKFRLVNHLDHAQKTKGHRHAMAMRYMIKMFLKDLYFEWRKVEGLPIWPDYQGGKLGYVHREAV